MSDSVAITVQSEDGLESKLEPRFGRAPFFLIVRQRERAWDIVDTIANGAKDDAHGAGGRAAAMLSRAQVNAVISGRFGPKAYQALTLLEIDMWVADGGITAADALSAYLNGALEKMKVSVY